MLQHALEYAKLGWATFPVSMDCRNPLYKGGCHASSKSADGLAMLFREPSNIALACGHNSGVLVLDIDVKTVDGLGELARLEDENGQLPDGPESCTPSGGKHLFFKHPRKRLSNRVGFRPGLDIRGFGGSVALPPSKRTDGAYRWNVHPRDAALPDIPDWLFRLIDPPTLIFKRVRRDYGVSENYALTAMRNECGTLSVMATGSGRNHQLFVSSARLGELVAANCLNKDLVVDELVLSAQTCGLIKEDGLRSVRATISSGLRRGLAKPRDIRRNA